MYAYYLEFFVRQFVSSPSCMYRTVNSCICFIVGVTVQCSIILLPKLFQLQRELVQMAPVAL